MLDNYNKMTSSYKVIFKNKFTLDLKNEIAESEFQENLIFKRINYKKYFSLILFLCALADIILQNCLYEKAIRQNYTVIKVFLYTAYVICPISFVSLILSFLINNKKFLSFVTAINFLFLFFPITNMRTILFETNLIGEEIYTLLTVIEIFTRIIMIFLILIPFPNGFYLNVILLIFVIFYSLIINKPYIIIFYFISILTYITIIFFETFSLKEKLNFRCKLEDQNKWYVNLFDHLHTGFISFTFTENSKKINFINETVLDIFKMNREFKLLFKHNVDGERCRILTAQTGHDFFSDGICEEDLIENSENVLKYILKDVEQENEDYLFNDNNISNKDFNLNNFLKEFETIYKNKNMDEKFLFVGQKIIHFGRKNSIDSSDTRSGLKVFIYEVFLRCRDNSELGKIEFELLLNDISNIKKIEEKKAEVKYKSMYLSKIAHELKNPIIAIQELVKDFYDNYSKEFAFTTKKKIKESFKYLKQICSFTDYLLILIKDLDFFSQMQIEEDVSYINSKVDLNEIIAYIREIADALLLKFNKLMNVQFLIENNLPNNIVLNADEVKIKQILTNLMSNSIKSTNKGVIKLKLDLIQNIQNNFIKFEISDTGVGMSDEQLKSILRPFKKSSGAETKYGGGLGMYIVSQILKRMNSEIKIESKLGQGTQVCFSLPCNIEELSPDENEKTVSVSDQQLVLALDRNNISADAYTSVRESPEISFIDRGRRNENISESERNPNSILFGENSLDFLQQELQHNIDINQPQLNINYIIFVDDEKLTRKSSIRVLEKAAEKINKKIKVFEAEDGIECIFLTYKLIKNGFKVSAIVSDEMMNHMNGTFAAEILKRVKNLNTNNIPYFLLTAYPDVENKFIDFKFTKPLNISNAEFILNYNAR